MTRTELRSQLIHHSNGLMSKAVDAHCDALENGDTDELEAAFLLLMVCYFYAQKSNMELLYDAALLPLTPGDLLRDGLRAKLRQRAHSLRHDAIEIHYQAHDNDCPGTYDDAFQKLMQCLTCALMVCEELSVATAHLPSSPSSPT